MNDEARPDERVIEWLQDGAWTPPVELLESAVAYARSHPRGKHRFAGWRGNLMSGIQLTPVRGRPASHRTAYLAFAAVAAAVVIAVGSIGGILTLPGPWTQPGVAGLGSPSPSPSLSPSPSPNPTPTPTPMPWSSGQAAAVVGTIDCGVLRVKGDETATAPYTLSGQVLDCTTTLSDPRVSGTGSLVLNVAGRDPALGHNAISWVYQEIDGPAGTWAGRGYGLYDQEGTAHTYTVLAGSGAYEGLIYVAYGTVPLGSAVAETVGVIQPGSPPPGFPVTPFPTN